MRILDRLIELPGSASRLPAMEGLRAYAAAVVFQVHFFGAWARVARGVDLDELRLQGIGEPGLAFVYYLWRSHYGVDLFFFLSGFLVFGLVTKPGFRYGPFLRDRLLRLYPVFFATTIGIAALRHGGEHFVTANLLANLLLLNGVRGLGVAPINTPTWSLLFEFAFYAGFPVILLARKVGGRIDARHVLALAGLFLLATCGSRGYAWRAISFFAGAWLASQDPARVRRWAAALPDAAVLALFLGATTSFVLLPRYATFLWVFLLPCVALGVVVLYGDGFLARFFRARPLRAFGNVSYSFYLVHGFAVSVVFRFVRDVMPTGGLAAVAACAAAYVVCFALSTALAVALFAALEWPYFAWKRRRRRRALPADDGGSPGLLAIRVGERLG